MHIIKQAADVGNWGLVPFGKSERQEIMPQGCPNQGAGELGY